MFELTKTSIKWTQIDSYVFPQIVTQIVTMSLIDTFLFANKIIVSMEKKHEKIFSSVRITFKRSMTTTNPNLCPCHSDAIITFLPRAYFSLTMNEQKI